MTIPEVTFIPAVDIDQASSFLRQGRAIDAWGIFQLYFVEWREEERNALRAALSGDTKLICEAAIVAGAEELVDWLFSQGMKIDCRCPDDCPVDHVLACCMNADSPHGARTIGVFESLLKSGANPNSIALGGGTLPMLQYAISIGKLDFASLLLDFGADPKLKNEMGLDAYEYATRYGKTAASTFLKAYSKSSAG